MFDCFEPRARVVKILYKSGVHVRQLPTQHSVVMCDWTRQESGVGGTSLPQGGYGAIQARLIPISRQLCSVQFVGL